MTGGPHFTGQTHFPENDCLLIDRDISETRSDRGDDPEIDGRFVDRNSTDEINEDVIARELEPDTFFEHGDEQRDTIDLDPLCRASPGAEPGRTDERLNFDEHRPGPLHRRHDGGAGSP